MPTCKTYPWFGVRFSSIFNGRTKKTKRLLAFILASSTGMTYDMAVFQTFYFPFGTKRLRVFERLLLILIMHTRYDTQLSLPTDEEDIGWAQCYSKIIRNTCLHEGHIFVTTAKPLTLDSSVRLSRSLKTPLWNSCKKKGKDGEKRTPEKQDKEK